MKSGGAAIVAHWLRIAANTPAGIHSMKPARTMAESHKFPNLRPGQYARRLGCRCPICKNSRNIDSVVRRRVVATFRQMHPDLWEQIVDQAYADIGKTRHRTGRPKQA